MTGKNNNCEYFDTITIINCDAQALNKVFLENQINIRVKDNRSISLSFNETTN